MGEHTTIQVRTDQAKQLKSIAREDESYKSVISRLIDDYTAEDDATEDEQSDGLTRNEFEARIRDVADDIASQTAKTTADEIESRLR